MTLSILSFQSSGTLTTTVLTPVPYRPGPPVPAGRPRFFILACLMSL